MKLERLSLVVGAVWMSSWVDGVSLPAVDFSQLTESVIAYSLLEHESEQKNY